MNAETTKTTTAKSPAPTAKSSAPKKTATAKPAQKKTPDTKKPKKEAKVKVVRDSFTMPQAEYQKIADIKAACLKTGMHVKKSEVLRAGLQALTALSTAQLKSALGKLDKIATGRPKKH